MLSTSNLSAAQAENYYIQEDYYTQEDPHLASYWAGKGAAALELTGTVQKVDFANLLAGVAPEGQCLSGKSVEARKRRAATDYTFSAPKSVSIAALIQQDKRVLQAHQQAVTQALAVLETRYAQTRVSTPSGRRRIHTDNLVAAVFTHATNRAVEPQLHSHCVVINATQLPDGRWYSFSNEAAVANQKLLGQIYQNELAIALRQQGYEIQLKPHGQFDLVGYSPELLQLFSTRRQQIMHLLATWEAAGTTILATNGQEIQAGIARREAANLRSRKQKPKAIEPDRLWRGWNALIQLKGLELPAIPQVDQQAGPQASESPEPIVQNAVQHCSERETVFQQTQIERFVLEHHLGQQRFEAWQQAIAHNAELIEVGDGNYTTQAAWNLELDTVRFMQAGKGQVSAIATLDPVNAHLENKSLTAGHPFRSLQAGGMTTARLDENLWQQTQELRAAVQRVAQGKVAEGIQALNQAGWIQAIVDPDQRRNQLVEDYLRLLVPERQRTLLLAGTNRDQWELTQKIRQRLQAEGSLGPDAFTMTGLRQKDLTTAQVAYVSAFEPGEIVVPNQDYKKQGLVKRQQYRVVARDRTTNQLTLETPTGQVIPVNPAQCARKTVYQVQHLPVAVGDRLKWTQNDRAAGSRNGQTFTVQHLAADGTAQILDRDGNSRRVNFSGTQFIDAAWVSTISSSQGKTADQVLALLDGMTLNRESFYVTVSRAKYQLTLYTAEVAELTQRAQHSTINENVSDSIPLFQVYRNAQTQKTQTHTIAASSEHRDRARRIGDCIGARLCQQLAATCSRDHDTEATNQQAGAGNAAVKHDRPIPAPNLDRHIAPLSTAIANNFEQQQLLQCAGELAAAVAALDCSLEYLEQATASRTQLATAITRLDAAIDKQAHLVQPSDREQRHRDRKLTVSERVAATPTTLPSPASFLRERYQQMWQQYSQGVQASNSVQRDYWISRRAFAAGCSQKEIARMLTVGSSYVQQLHQSQGRDKAREYINQTARAVCQPQQLEHLPAMKLPNQNLELGD